MSNIVDLQSVFDFSKPNTQRAFAGLIGVSEMTVSDLKRRGVIAEGQALGEWLHKYCAHIREIAAGRAANGEIDLVTERAFLAKSQRERIDMQNAVTRQEFGPIDALEQGLSDCMARVASKLETIPGKLKLANDKLTADDLDQVAAVLAEVRNDIAGMEIDWFGEKTEEGDDIDVDLDA